MVSLATAWCEFAISKIHKGDKDSWRTLSLLTFTHWLLPMIYFSVTLITEFTVPKFAISQSEANSTVLISYDIKSLTWLCYRNAKFWAEFRLNSPDMPPKHTKKVRLGICIVCWREQKLKWQKNMKELFSNEWIFDANNKEKLKQLPSEIVLRKCLSFICHQIVRKSNVKVTFTLMACQS